jgi:hypothetical protein
MHTLRAAASVRTVPKIVPSGRLDALGCKLGRATEPRIFTSESECIQTALNYWFFVEPIFGTRGSEVQILSPRPIFLFSHQLHRRFFPQVLLSGVTVIVAAVMPTQLCNDARYSFFVPLRYGRSPAGPMMIADRPPSRSRGIS